MTAQASLNLDGADLCDDCGRPPGYLAGPTADLPAGTCCGRPIHGACYPPKILGFAVVCEDGETRHPGLFATRHEADRWAAWGHLCTARHTIRPIQTADPQPASSTQETP